MSASGKSFTFNSIDYGGASYNLYAKIKSLPRMPKPRVNIDSLANGDGVVTQGSTFDETRIQVGCACTGANAAAVETLVANTVAALSATQLGLSELIFDAFPARAYQARLISSVEGSIAMNGEMFDLEFIVPSGWYTASSSTETGDIAVDVSGVTTI